MMAEFEPMTLQYLVYVTGAKSSEVNSSSLPPESIGRDTSYALKTDAIKFHFPSKMFGLGSKLKADSNCERREVL